MKSYLEKVVSELPSFLSKFAACVSRPRTFIAQHVAVEGEGASSDTTAADQLTEKGVAFLITAFLISFFLSVALPVVTDPATMPTDDAGFLALGIDALLELFLFLAAMAIGHGVLRMFGAKTPFSASFGLSCYFCGVALVLGVAANATTNIAMVDPVTASSWVKLENTYKTLGPRLQQVVAAIDPQTGELPDSVRTGSLASVIPTFEESQRVYANAVDRPLYRIATGIQTTMFVAILLWLLVAWFAYGASQSIGTWKMILATIITAAILGAGYVIYIFVTAAPAVMNLYRSHGAPH